MNQNLMAMGAVSAWVCSMSGWAAAQEQPLSEGSAARLIALRNEMGVEQIRVGLIQEGEARNQGFKGLDACRVIAIHPVPENGRMVRRVQEYQFQWNQVYGWYCWEKRPDRGGDALWIWSELKGEVVLR